MYEFDEDTRIREESLGVYRANLTDRWSIGWVPNGGYVMAIALDALARVLPSPDPLSASAHFLRPARPGEAEIRTEIVKVGSMHATASARLLQEGKEILRVLATFGDLSQGEGPTVIAGEPPPLSAPDACLTRGEGDSMPEIANRFDQRFDPDTMRWVAGERSGVMEIRAWQRFADGREPDVRAIPVFADALPPPIFNAVPVGWAPTVELTIHLRARPSPGWLRTEFRTRFLFGGYLEEDGEIWDESNKLVALSRQLAVAPRT
jgi:acyl-CoA thioesterase